MMNNKTHFVAALLLAGLLAACNKKDKVETPAPAPAPAPTSPAPAAASVPAPAPAPAAEPTPEEVERAKKQAKLDYATMENDYLNDALGQWAESAKASSTYGDDKGTALTNYLPAEVVGAPNGKTWWNNHTDMGFDSVEATYAKPVHATEVRIVCSDSAVQSISKVEVQDTAGGWSTVWSGLNSAKPELNGPRNWFVKKFPKTSTQVKAVKVTFANNLAAYYKEVDAIQLIGE
jgi:hypothetical protein